MMNKSLGIVVMTIIFGLAMGTCALSETLSREIPPELARWRAWVLHGHEEALCPGRYNDGTQVRCQWPSYLQIDVSDDGGRFEQRWQIFAPVWVALPGSTKLWPQDVVADGRPVAVIDRNRVPSIHLKPGIYLIKGRFPWSRPPEMIQVPPEAGLLDLTVGGRQIVDPVIDAQGRLWLQKQEQTADSDREDRIKVSIFRLINDAIPMQVTTLVRMDVSGQAREIGLEGVLLSNSVPLKLDSRLPARLDKQGRLLVQARPGRWQVRITTRMPESVLEITIPSVPYGEEVWSFQPQNHLRMVELSGAPQIEPGQTEMPGTWRRYAAYLIKGPTALVLKEIRRGDPDPAPDQLSLHRRWWLDFDGNGLTLHDRIQGTLSRQWFLAVNSPLVLGRVAIDGKDQVITAQGEEKKAGVELRRGSLNLQADARLPERTINMAALGWDHDFQKVSGQLHLPPGWRLLAAPGVDHVSDTWLQRWSLLDFFVVLIIALAVFKLRNWKWGLLALGTLALIFHEPGAPRLVWLHILAALALLPLLPAGWLRRLISMWGITAGVILLITAIPFVANQIRWGIYPQLAPHSDFVAKMDRATPDLEMAPKAVLNEASRPTRGRALKSSPASPSKNSLGVDTAKEAKLIQAARAIQQRDPDELIPTGPGLPDWQWHTISLGWSGPVAKDQVMRLYLISPLINLVLSLLRVGLLAFLIWGLFEWRAWWLKIRQQIDAKAVTAAVMLAATVGLTGVNARAEQGAFPPAELLETFRQRLLAPADCLPQCADISSLDLAISDDVLQMMLKIHAAEATAVPLPVSRKSWTPSKIEIDNAPLSSLARDESGTLWAVVPPGAHSVILSGSVAHETKVAIPLPLRPHRAGFVAKGWVVKGILPDGRVGSSIQLDRLPSNGKERISPFASDSEVLQPFLAVERILHLGLTWQVSTRIRRITPLGKPIVAHIPLLADESVTTAGFQVEQGSVFINMSAQQRQLNYSSNLKIGSTIALSAPKKVPWSETWVLDASPIWHCDLSGIAPIHHQDSAGQWQPRWQPWPGDTVTIDVVRPEALKGQVVTIRKTHITLTPGQRFGIGELVMQISTSRGGQHTLALPDKASLQKVRVDGKSLPIRQDGQWVTVPLQPGTQNVSVLWHQLSAFGLLYRAPALKIGEKAVNAKVTMKLPDRWILLVGGPNWGPAVLFWSYLVVVVIAALGLGRLTLTPWKSWQWLLLGLGLTQIPAAMALLIVGWLIVLGMRERHSMPEYWLGYNALQLGIIIWGVAAMFALFAAVKAGLIGQPEMQIAGNHSNGWTLHWTQDRITEAIPRPWVLSLPVWVYRGLMLAWSLWLASALLGWLKWGWGCIAKDGIWKKMPPRRQTRPKGEKGAAVEASPKT